jgi:hypothetical protein
MTLLITSDPITLQIKKGETKQIDVNQDNITDFEIKLISIISGKAKFSLVKLGGADIAGKEEMEKEATKEALFDVKMSIVNLFETVMPGREVISNIEVLNVNSIGRVDVSVSYYITSAEDGDNATKLAEGSDTLAVEAAASFVRSLKVPYNLKAGKYLFNVKVSYKDLIVAGGNVEFRVVKSYELIIAGGVALLIVAGIVIYLISIKREEEKDVRILKREIKKLRKREKR